MRPVRWDRHGAIIGVLCLAVAMLAVVATTASPAPALDPLFAKFWDARSPQDAARAAAPIVTSGVSVADALARLRRGRPYSANVPRGIVHLHRRTAGVDFFYDLDVPQSYDPQRQYQVRVQLHGGVSGRMRSEPPDDGSTNVIAGADQQIYVLPYAWSGAPWWTDAQVANLRAILDAVKRTYNVDENRVALAGISDGATATYYYGMRDTTPFASFLSLNGFFMVLSNPLTHAEGELFPNNLLNKPFFVVNGGADPLYPAWLVDPFVGALQEAGMDVEYWPQPTAGHNTSWWPEMKDPFELFVRDHPRDPLPAKLTWESDGTPLTNRAHWLTIDRLNQSRDGAPLPDLSDVVLADNLQPASPKLYIHTAQFGRVDLVRTGNVVDATTRGVAAFTLLVSPDVFDLSQPITVKANGRTVFEGRVQPSLATLFKWAARDNDRTMLFVAELHITVE